jgi:predicted nucleotidyltransferase
VPGNTWPTASSTAYVNNFVQPAHATIRDATSSEVSASRRADKAQERATHLGTFESRLMRAVQCATSVSYVAILVKAAEQPELPQADRLQVRLHDCARHEVDRCLQLQPITVQGLIGQSNRQETKSAKPNRAQHRMPDKCLV